MITFVSNPVTADSLMYIIVVTIVKRDEIKELPLLGIIKELEGYGGKIFHERLYR